MTLLAARGLVKDFGAVRAVDGVSFDMAAGEMVAIIGPNGAGKTTCFNILGGQLRPDAGQVLLGGMAVAGLGAERLWRLGVGRTFQVASVFGSLTVRENVQLALAAAEGRTRAPFGRARARDRAGAEAVLRRVGLLERAGQACGTLAYGDLKRLDLALGVAGAPRLLLMDEPTAGMSRLERGALMDTVRALAAETGLGVLFTEHDMDVVFGHADRVLVLHQGRVVAEGAPEAVRRDARARAVYLGDDDAAA